MDKVSKILLVHIPVDACNFKCPYCYIGQLNRWTKYNEDVGPMKNQELIARAFDQKRFGGPCFINMCAKGETLIYKEAVDTLETILSLGHYVELVTNGTLTNRFKVIASFPKEYLERLEFKFSFHYTELIRLEMMDVFFDNIKMMKEAGASFTVEITPFDDEENKIEEIKRICIERLGAVCHATIARDDRRKDIPVFSKHNLQDYYKIWSTLNSPMLDWKYKIFQERRNEFCYAGAWSLYINLINGDLARCYRVPMKGNFYNLDKPLPFGAVGKCQISHCYNGHAMLPFGLLPSVNAPTYAEIRNRICSNGTEWLSPTVKSFFETRLNESNDEYDEKTKKRVITQRKREKIRRDFNDLFRKIGIKIKKRFRKK